MVKISVIIPVYNAENYLRQCLDSLEQQSFKDFEMIVVNDGSTDNSLSIIQNYASKDSQIKIISQKNQGLSVARNNALQIAQGKYIAFIDADDWIEPDFLEKMFFSIQSSDADVIQSGFIQNKKSTIYSPKNLTTFLDVLLHVNKCFVWNKLWKADFLKDNKLKFIPNTYYEDVPFCLEAAFYTKSWNIIDYAGYHYEINPISITNDVSLERVAKRQKDKQIIIQKMVDFFKQKNCKSSELESVENFLISQLLENSDLLNKEAYQNYKKIFGNNDLFIRKRRKALRKWLFQLSFKKKKFILLGHSFWKNNKV